MELFVLQPEADPRPQITRGYTASYPHVREGYLGCRSPTRCAIDENAEGAIPRPSERIPGPSWISTNYTGLVRGSSGSRSAKRTIHHPGLREGRTARLVFKFTTKYIQGVRCNKSHLDHVLRPVDSNVRTRGAGCGETTASHGDHSMQPYHLWTVWCRRSNLVVMETQHRRSYYILWSFGRANVKSRRE